MRNTLSIPVLALATFIAAIGLLIKGSLKWYEIATFGINEYYRYYE